MGLPWEAADVARQLRARMVGATEVICQVRDDLGVTMRQAAYVHALCRIGEAVDARGCVRSFARTQRDAKGQGDAKGQRDEPA